LKAHYFEFGDGLSNRLFKTTYKILSEIVKYLKFHSCEDSMTFVLNFGSFPNGSYATVLFVTCKVAG